MYYPNSQQLPGRNADYTKISEFDDFLPVLQFIIGLSSANQYFNRYLCSAKMSKIPGHFTILYFASASSYTSKDSEALAAPLHLSKLFDTLEEKYAGIKSKVLESCLVTINLEYVDLPKGSNTENEVIIKEGDEIAIIPPVSSG